MKPTWIVVLPLLFANFAMAEGTVFDGEEIKGDAYVTASNHQAIFWLSGNLAETVYGHMREEVKEAENCAGKIKHFPGFLCSKNENSFGCLIKVNLKTGLLEGESGELCKHTAKVTKKTPLTTKRIWSDEQGMFLYLIGSTAKTIYKQMAVKPIADDHGKGEGCMTRNVKRFSGLECSLYKNRHECFMYINLEARKMEFYSEVCPEDND
jgi:hypothetical protein